MDMEDFNSSDLEFEPPQSKRPTNYPGQASIDLIVAFAARDRVSSKKTVKQLEFGFGAPRTREDQSLWIGRFNAFRAHVLHQPINHPFTGDDLIRFFDTIIGKLNPKGAGKPGPNQSLVTTALKILIEYGTFMWPDTSVFKYTSGDGIRMKNWVEDAIKARRLTRGLWRQRVWITFNTVSRMSRAWLDHHSRKGTIDWDITIYKLMSVVLVTALGCRGGDAARSRGYIRSEYLHYRHIDLVLDKNQEERAELHHLRARFTLEYPKGFKDVRNEQQVYYLRPLEDTGLAHMCALSLLLIHGLRNGLLAGGSTVRDVLDEAAASQDNRVAWLFPNRPVLCSIESKSGHRRLDLDKPTGTFQLLNSVKSMGLVSNILTRVEVHGLRRGTARDLAHLPEKPGSGAVTNELREALGHNLTTFQRGTTQAYAGGITREFYNDRSKRPYDSVWGPKFSDQSAIETVMAPVSDAEILAWLKSNESIPANIDRHVRKRARKAIRSIRHQEFLRTARPEVTMDSATTASDRALLPKCDNQLNMMQSPPDGDLKSSALARELGKIQCPPVAIDPQLLGFAEDDAGDIVAVPQADINSLCSRLGLTETFPSSTKPGSTSADNEINDLTSTEEFLRTIPTEDLDAQDDGLPAFIAKYSRMNIIYNENFAKPWSQYKRGSITWEDGPALHSVTGNSRDPPTPWLFKCNKTRGCTFSSVLKGSVLGHEIICNEQFVAKVDSLARRVLDFKCSHEDCNQSFVSAGKLNAHVKEQHTFTPKPCPFGCSPTKVYQSEKVFEGHLAAQHSDHWPTVCLHPDSSASTKTFHRDVYRIHLRDEHGLTDTKAREVHFPNKQFVRCWDEQAKCPELGCSESKCYAHRYNLRMHFKKKHGYSNAKAASATSTFFVMKPYQEWLKVKR